MVQQFNESAGNTAFSFNGNEDEARKLIPTAQNLLYKLRGFLATSGSKVFSMTTRASNGSVTASSIEGIEKVIITADGQITDEPVYVEGVEILSGAVRGGEIVSVTPPVVGASNFETLKIYKPTDQSYKYPLKKRPGNYPKTVILPGDTFEEQPRLAVPAFPLIAAYMHGINMPVECMYYGDYDKALEIAQGLLVEINQLGPLQLRKERATVSTQNGYYIHDPIEYVAGVPPTYIGGRILIYGETSGNYSDIDSYNALNPSDKSKFVGSTDVDPSPSKTPITLINNFGSIPKSTNDVSGQPIPAGSGHSSQYYGSIAASMYSGKIAKAVQIILGYGKLKSKKSALMHQLFGVQVKYDWRWARCHGITEATDGRLWLVEISINNGVIAMPLPVFSNTVKGTAIYSYCLSSNQNVLRESVRLFGGLPSGGTFPPSYIKPAELSLNPNAKTLSEAIESGDVIRLATTAQLSDYFEKYPVSHWHGWSFKQNGREAHNIALYDTPERKSFHFKLDLQIGDSVRESQRHLNQPIASGSAALTVVANGPVRPTSFSFLLTKSGDTSGLFSTIESMTPGSDAEPTKTPIFVCHIADELVVINQHKVNGVDLSESYPPGRTVLNIDGSYSFIPQVYDFILSYIQATTEPNISWTTDENKSPSMLYGYGLTFMRNRICQLGSRDCYHKNGDDIGFIKFVLSNGVEIDIANPTFPVGPKQFITGAWLTHSVFGDTASAVVQLNDANDGGGYAFSGYKRFINGAQNEGQTNSEGVSYAYSAARAMNYHYLNGNKIDKFIGYV